MNTGVRLLINCSISNGTPAVTNHHPRYTKILPGEARPRTHAYVHAPGYRRGPK
ncbi:MAG: hypothetical protein J7599_06200 [Niabella sp.]|nr:hypothetical protein [Niabella sp.]